MTPPLGGVKFEEEAVMTVLGGAVPTSERRGRFHFGGDEEKSSGANGH